MEALCETQSGWWVVLEWVSWKGLCAELPAMEPDLGDDSVVALTESSEWQWIQGGGPEVCR